MGVETNVSQDASSHLCWPLPQRGSPIRGPNWPKMTSLGCCFSTAPCQHNCVAIPYFAVVILLLHALLSPKDLCPSLDPVRPLQLSQNLNTQSCRTLFNLLPPCPAQEMLGCVPIFLWRLKGDVRWPPLSCSPRLGSAHQGPRSHSHAPGFCLWL